MPILLNELTTGEKLAFLYAKKTGYSLRTIQKLCKAGAIAGAVKVDGAWYAPESALLSLKKPQPARGRKYKQPAVDA